MELRVKHILLLILLVYFIQGISFGQDSYRNKSFVHTDFLTRQTNHYYMQSGIVGTNDGGFAYLVQFPCCAVNRDYTKFNFSKSIFDPDCFEIPDYREESRGKSSIFLYPRILLIKVNGLDKIVWAKSIFNEKLMADGGYGLLKQTKDNGFIIFSAGRIIKTDSTGNTIWKIYFDKDSIPGINKNSFLIGAMASDIYECSDGSFIALLSSSFSLLKISKDGKPLWLKSTIFDEFCPMVFEYYSIDDEKINNSDSIVLNKFTWKQGGGVYVPAYKVYETDDGGYMTIGQNLYRVKDNIKLHEKGDYVLNKVFVVDTGKYNEEVRIRVFPKKIYEIRNMVINDPKLSFDEKLQVRKKNATVVIKTDNNGNVLWTRQFGNMSYDTPPHSDLIKLANKKYLVRIRNCNLLSKKDAGGNPEFGGPHSEFFIIDENGNSQETNGINVFECDPYNIQLAPDSGYYMFEQSTVTRTDKNLKILWQRPIPGWPEDGAHAVTSDTGVLCSNRGRIFKYDKYGHELNKEVKLDSVVVKKQNVHFYFNNELPYLYIKKKGKKGLERQYVWKSELDKEIAKAQASGNPLPEDFKYKISINPGEKMSFSRLYDDGKLVNDSWILDLNDTLQLQSIIIDARRTVATYGYLYPTYKNDVNTREDLTKIEIKDLKGYRQVYIKHLCKGKYNFEFRDAKNNLILESSFEIK